VRRLFEIVAILAVYIAVREVLWAGASEVEPHIPALGGIPFYLMWAAVLGVVAWRPGWVPRILPLRSPPNGSTCFA
jgi:hypothetical protein